MRGLDYRWVEALEAVIRCGSFERAATELFVSQSAISQRIKQLEKFAAQPILIREHPPKPTILGQKLLGLYTRVQLLEQELVPDLNNESSQLTQSISIATNADSLAVWLLPALAPLFKQKRVEVNLAVNHENQTLDKLKTGEVAGAISTESKTMVGCEAIYLGRVDYVCVASPEFSERYFSDGFSRQALLSAPAVSFDHNDDFHRDFLERNYDIDPNSVINHKVASSEAFVNMALLGCAYCLIPKIQIEQELLDGRLIDVAPDMVTSFNIYWHHWQLETGLLKEVTEKIVTYAHSFLPQS
jgi:LysR family transcriptional regulator (chromosome initiation inhibitor)